MPCTSTTFKPVTPHYPPHCQFSQKLTLIAYLRKMLSISAINGCVNAVNNIGTYSNSFFQIFCFSLQPNQTAHHGLLCF